MFPATDNGQERWRWFLLTLQAILVPITASRTSNRLRAMATLFGVDMAPSRYYTFMASVKRRWESVWAVLWRAIPDPLTDGRLLVALDDAINPKTGRQVFGGQHPFDPAAKTHQSPYPWAQTLVTVGLLKVVHDRWACLPRAFACYLRRQTLRAGGIRVRGQAVVFQSKFAQAVRLLAAWARVFGQAPILVVADRWFGNQGLLKPWRAALGPRAHLLSRLRVNAVRYEQPAPTPGTAGRPRKYGARLGNAAQLAADLRAEARTDTLNL
ncbi:MAG: transposase [Burkholderiaceae bacterium]|nr:transposase [Burkholderiaceae bacterium]